jgi:hypothetical protein
MSDKVSCLRCDWVGTVSELVTGTGRPACPKCRERAIQYSEDVCQEAKHSHVEAH